MMVVQNKILRRTRGHRDIHDLTDEADRLVGASGVKTGMAHLCVIGSTAALGTIEFEPGLARDLPELLDRLVPPDSGYGHEQAWHDGNGHSHLQATLLGPSLSMPIQSGQLTRGTWQQIFLLECDIRPRERVVVLTAMGE
jgi:secondary thiamine-phosphate synthase enzyme